MTDANARAPKGSYFVYALIDPREYRATKDELLSIFYVGKGRGERPREHELAVRRDLRAAEQGRERLESKAHRIRQILDRGEHVTILILADEIHNEDDAYTAESLAMTLIDALLTRSGRTPLTNATPGHRQGVRRVGASDLGGIEAWTSPFDSHTVDIGSRQFDLVGGDASGHDTARDHAPETSAILVKGTRVGLDAPGQRLVRGGLLPREVQAFAGRIKVLEINNRESSSRPGWDPDMPWDDQDARERARRYWRFGRSRVSTWLGDQRTQPRHLMLGIPTPSGETVVRYVWEIDPDGSWEYFPDGGQWGVPLGRRDHDHPFLNHALYETSDDGVRRQVLHGYSSGWRHIVVAGRKGPRTAR